MNINEALIEGKGNIIIKYTLVIPNSGASVDLNITVSSGKPNNDSVSIIISDEDDGNGIELLQSYLKDHYGTNMMIKLDIGLVLIKIRIFYELIILIY